MQKKYGNDNIQVVLMSVDSSQELYDQKAEKLFAEYGGSQWQSIVLPGGFNGALHFGDFGFGKIILDKDGKVLSINPFDLEKELKQIFGR